MFCKSTWRIHRICQFGTHGFVKVVKWICQSYKMNLSSCVYSSPSAKSNQPEVWPKLQNLLKLLLLLLNWTGSGCWKYKLCNLWVWFVIQYYVPHFFSQFQRLSFSNIDEMVWWWNRNLNKEMTFWTRCELPCDVLAKPSIAFANLQFSLTIIISVQQQKLITFTCLSSFQHGLCLRRAWNTFAHLIYICKSFEVYM